MATTANLGRLRELASDPTALTEHAIALLAPGQGRAANNAALDVLRARPAAESRPALIALYAHLDENGPKRDAGAFLRRAIIAALRPVALPSDAELLARAARTVERMPPSFKDEAGGLRAAALIALNEVDEGLAAFHATRLLADEHADPMSGEPGVAAARVLGSQEALLPLYLLALQVPTAALPEVVSECLRQLTGLPVPLVEGLLARHAETSSAAVRVGLYDLLANHRAGPQGLSFLEGEMARLKDADLYRYLLVTLLSARREGLNAAVLRAGPLKTDARKIAVLLESLAVFDLGAAGAALAEKLARRRQPKRG
jgi:hypothetical protein